MNRQAPTGDKEEPLIEHIRALRKCLVNSALIIFIGFCICYYFSERIFDFIRAPIAPHLKTPSGGLVFTGVIDKFIAHIKVSFLAGTLITTPLWLKQVWSFVAPGLYAHEKRYGLAFVLFGSLLFTCGAAFLYYIVFPMAFSFLMEFGGSTDQAMITIQDYLSFFITTTLVFGLAFELPLVLAILGMLGVIDHKFLVEKRRYAIVLLAFISAVATPPDVLSMIVMMVPMLLLYELSVILVRGLGRPRQSVANRGEQSL